MSAGSVGHTRSAPLRRVAGAVVLLSALAAAAYAPAAEIYRCKESGTTVFSDVPCAETAEVYRAGDRLSVVQAAEELETVSAENREFIEQRRQKLAERREAAANQRRLTERAREAAERRGPRTRTIISPSLYEPAPRNRSPDPRSEQRRRRDRRDGRDEDLERRRTLLSRSGSDQPLIPREPPRYQ